MEPVFEQTRKCVLGMLLTQPIQLVKFLTQLNQANPIRIPWSSTNKIRFCFDNSLATLQWNVCISWLPIQKSIAITIFLRLQFTICMKNVILTCRYYFTCRLNAISIMWPLSWFRNKVTPSKRNNYLEMEVPIKNRNI